MKRYRKSFFKWISISLLCLYFGFMVGKFKQDILQNSIQLLELDVASLKTENTELIEKLNLLQADFIAEKQSNDALVIENKDLNTELESSNNKLYFYERVVAPELSITGLNVYSFNVTKLAEQNLWSYELVLMQSQKGRRFLKGNVDILFTSVDDAKQNATSIKLSAIDDSFNGTFKFKYFQTLKGQFTLPNAEDFAQVFVVAEAVGNRWNRAQRVEKIYDWQNFIENDATELKEVETQSEGE
ncbi:hypothetical protein E2R68_09230 [Psychromonas sp. RZ22]|uniref:DUF6776 family protein n=1 Tax=Psychromonas algarum TaxID=2555643 RepID=UPI00106754ED|nr:DUF6776 family protein [Psychromonas sp. RZ22]TEW54444.1 hypothetical protein E2R68_09230 [Psychromonas sp. RZ22]